MSTPKSCIRTLQQKTLSGYLTRKVAIKGIIPFKTFPIHCFHNVNMVNIVVLELALSSFPQCGSLLPLSILIAMSSLQLVSSLLCELQEPRQQRNGSVCWYAAIYKELTEEWGKA